MTGRGLTFSRLLAEMIAVVRIAPIAIALTFAALAGLGIYLDTSIVDPVAISAVTLGIALATLGFQLWMVRLLLGPDGRRHRPAIIGLLLLSTVLTIAISLGAVLLLLPGLYLAARWRVAVPILLARDVSVGEALNASWRATGAAWRPLMLASAGVALPYAATLMVFLAAETVDVLSLREAIAANALLYAATVGSWVLDVAAYRLVASPDAALAETFA